MSRSQPHKCIELCMGHKCSRKKIFENKFYDVKKMLVT